jgi:hypothetical protein
MKLLPEKWSIGQWRLSFKRELIWGLLSIAPAAHAQAGTTSSPSQSPLQSRPPQRETPAMIVGSDVQPAMAVESNQPRVDPSSNLLVNAVGARTGRFGAAAHEGLTWANRYVPGTDQNGIVQLYSLSTSGNYGAFFGTRSSDNHNVGAQNVIGSINLVVADSDRPHLHWAQYSEGYVPRGSTAFRLLINDENSIQNDGNRAPTADPYDFNPQHLLNNLRVDCGIGLKGAQSCSNPLSILNNGADYRVGILFGDKSVELVDGAANALVLPADYALSWFGAPGAPTWRVYSTARKIEAGRLIMGDDAVSFQIGPRGKTPALLVEKDGIAAPAIIASGQLPAMSGSCAVRDQRGGNTAGAFTMAQDCISGTIIIGFSAVGPNGWSCFGSDLSRAEATLRETSYNRASATLAVSGARQSDQVVFSCTGF